MAVQNDLGYDALLGDCEDELTVAVQKDLGYDTLLGDCEDELTVAVEKDLGYDALLGDCEDELTVAVQKNLGYDTLLGTDFLDLWGMGKHLLYDEIVNVVQTRSQADKTEHTSLPDNFKEINSRETDTESEEEEYDEGDGQPWEDQASEDSDNPPRRCKTVRRDNYSSSRASRPSSRASRRKARALFMTNKERHLLDHNGEHFQKEQKQDELI